MVFFLHIKYGKIKPDAVWAGSLYDKAKIGKETGYETHFYNKSLCGSRNKG